MWLVEARCHRRSVAGRRVHSHGPAERKERVNCGWSVKGEVERAALGSGVVRSCLATGWSSLLARERRWCGTLGSGHAADDVEQRGLSGLASAGQAVLRACSRPSFGRLRLVGERRATEPAIAAGWSLVAGRNRKAEDGALHIGSRTR